MPALTPADALDEFGSLMRAARDAKGWSQRELASQTGIAQSEVSALEAGTRRDIRASTVARLARHLSLDPRQLAAAAVKRAGTHDTPRIGPMSDDSAVQDIAGDDSGALEEQPTEPA
jgi:transcriptional regulator with XRE-family HTH domain